MCVWPAASDSGLGADHARRLRPLPTAVGLLAGLAAVTALGGWWVLPLALAAVLGAAAVGWLAMRKIGGLVGDVLGAIEQVVECLVLIVVSGLAARHQVWWA
jgi:adenosylcobinamide-GDP ribazoletransferase